MDIVKKDADTSGKIKLDSALAQPSGDAVSPSQSPQQAATWGCHCRGATRRCEVSICSEPKCGGSGGPNLPFSPQPWITLLLINYLLLWQQWKT